MATHHEMLRDWLNGTPNGGPNGDGRYPLMGQDGETYLVLCPAAQALDPTADPSELEIFTNTATEAATEAVEAADIASSFSVSAAASADQAAASATAAAGSASAAATSASQANTSRSQAATSATNAASSATAASNSASAAATSKSGADSAKTAAETARNKAQDWADKAEDSPVESGKFSARHWALKAAASAAALANIAWSAVSGKPSITAGNGLSGGGLLDTSKTITLGTPGTLSGSTANSVTSTSHTHALSANLSAWDAIAPGSKMSKSGDYFTGSCGYDTGVTTVPRMRIVHSGDYMYLQAGLSHTNNVGKFRLSGWVGDLLSEVRIDSDSVNIKGNEVWHSGTFNPNDYALASRSISAGNGLSGGGNLTANRSISLGTPGTLSGSTTNSVSSTSHTHALSANLSAWDGYHPNNAFVEKGSIPGSVDLNTYRTTGIYHQNANANATSGTNYPANSAGMLTVFESGSMTYQTYQIYNTGDVYTRSRYNTSWSAWKLSVDGTTTITAGNGLSGGGSLAANRTISLGTPGTITATSTNSVSGTSHTHNLDTTGNFTWNGNHTFIGDIIGRSGSASNQLEVERTGNSINCGIQYRTSAGTIYAGQGDAGHFNWGANSDIRWSHANTWARLGSGGLDLKGSLNLNGTELVSSGSAKALQLTTAHGYVRIGPANSSWCHFHTDRSSFYFGTSIAVAGDITFYNGPRVPKMFVQSGDPGSAASTGDLWIW